MLFIEAMGSCGVRSWQCHAANATLETKCATVFKSTMCPAASPLV